MIPSRPCPSTVRGRMMLTSWPAATASRQRSSPSSFAASVGFERTSRAVLGHRIRLGYPEDRARRSVDDLGDTSSPSREQHVRGPDRVHRPEQLAVACQRHLRDVVQDRIHIGTGRSEAVEISDIADDMVEAQILGPVEIEDPDLIAARARARPASTEPKYPAPPVMSSRLTGSPPGRGSSGCSHASRRPGMSAGRSRARLAPG